MTVGINTAASVRLTRPFWYLERVVRQRARGPERPNVQLMSCTYHTDRTADVQPVGCDRLAAMAFDTPDGETPDGDTTLHREIDLPIESDELWELIGDGESWEGWLGDDVAVEVEAGSVGSVTDDDGVARTVSIERVEPGERVEFTWWPTDEPEHRSRVDLVVVPKPEGSGLRITETFLTCSGLTC